MRAFKTLRVAEHQRVIWFRDGNFRGVLEPGKYRFWRRLRHTQFISHDIREGECLLAHARYLVEAHGDALKQHLDWKLIGDHEVGLVLVDRIARRLALPGEVVAWWRQGRPVEVKTLDIAADATVPAAWIRAVDRADGSFDGLAWRKATASVSVEEGFESILLIDGEVARILAPGRYAFWALGRELKIVRVDKRSQEVEIHGQEILTRDRVSLRTNASIQYRVVDSVRAVVQTQDIAALAYRAVQFALRRALGAVTLDELLTEKVRIADDVQADVSARLEAAGVAVAMVGIKDVVLPGEMRTILNRVVEAEKTAEANAIRRRDETQNVRSLANTARQLESNPMMARLKELEALQAVVASVETLNVYQGLDGVMSELVRLQRP